MVKEVDYLTKAKQIFAVSLEPLATLRIRHYTLSGQHAHNGSQERTNRYSNNNKMHDTTAATTD